MNKKYCLLVLLMTLFSIALFAKEKHYGIRFRLAWISSISGSFDDNLKMKDFVKPDLSYGIGICTLADD